jgi:hypothetical protein
LLSRVKKERAGMTELPRLPFDLAGKRVYVAEARQH